MQKFKDKTGFEWVVELDLQKVHELEASDFTAVYPKPVKLLGPQGISDPTFCMEAMTNTGLLAAMCFCIVKDQADNAKIGQEDFCKRMDGPALKRLKESMWDEFADFFQEGGTSLSTLIETFKGMSRRLDEKLVSKEVQDRMGSLIDEMLSKLAQDLPTSLVPKNGHGDTSGISPASLDAIGGE